MLSPFLLLQQCEWQRHTYMRHSLSPTCSALLSKCIDCVLLHLLHNHARNLLFCGSPPGICSHLSLIADLTNHMDRRTSNSGGSSAGSATAGGTIAPQSYGIQFMPQPQVMPSQMPSVSQGISGVIVSDESFCCNVGCDDAVC